LPGVTACVFEADAPTEDFFNVVNGVPHACPIVRLRNLVNDAIVVNWHQFETWQNGSFALGINNFGPAVFGSLIVDFLLYFFY
jgi:hypothetical protein